MEKIIITKFDIYEVWWYILGMIEKYTVVVYIKREPSTEFRKEFKTSDANGMPLEHAQEVAHDLTENNFRPGYSSLGVPVNLKALDNAPEVIHI